MSVLVDTEFYKQLKNSEDFGFGIYQALTLLLNLAILLTIVTLPVYNFRFQIYGFPFSITDLLISLTFLLWLTRKLFSPEKRKFNQSDQGKRELMPFALEKRKVETPVLIERRKDKLIQKPSFSILRSVWGRKVYWLLILSFVVLATSAALISPAGKNAWGDWRSYVVEPIIFGLVVFEEIGSQSVHRKTKWFELNQRRIQLILFLTATLTALDAAWQFLTGTNLTAPLEAAQGRVTSVFNNPNFLALFLGPIVILWLFNLLDNVMAPSRLWGLGKILKLVGLGLVIFAFIQTKSEGGLLSLIITLSTGLLVYLLRNWQFYLRLITIGLVGLTVSYLILISYLFYNISQFTPNYHDVYPRPDSSTITIRLCLWEGSLNLLKDNFWLGVGLSGFEKVYPEYQTCDTEKLAYPHHLIFNFWSEVGFLGMVTFLLFNGVLIYELLHKREIISIGLALALSYWLIHGQVDVPYFKNDLAVLFWLLVMLSLVVIEKPLKGRISS